MATADDCVQGHRVSIFDRGGSREWRDLTDLASVTWGRKRDGKSTASVTLSGRACAAQAGTIGGIESSRHELVVFRGGDRVWEGPVRSVKTLRRSATIAAADSKEYLDFTSLSKRWPNSEEGGPELMADRLSEIIDYELSTPYSMETNQGVVLVPRWETIAAPINVLPFLEVRPGSVKTTAVTEAFEMMLGEHMDDLTDGGLDWTFVGRRLLIWDSNLPLGRTRRLTDADFYGDIEVIQDGTRHASVAHLSATRSEDTEEDPDLGVGHAGGENDYYGVWETIVSQQSESGTAAPTQTALNGQAQRALTHNTPVPVEVRVPAGGGLRLGQGLSIADLVPGAIVPLSATMNLRTLSQDQRLDEVTVTETAAGETIQVVLSPWGDVEAVDV